ncbi:MAG: toll/interleukin-1 receptor domain-containing protein [Hyphomonadaceae bacterium]
MKHDIFVSYRRKDRELVANAVRKLEAAGVEVWYDAEIEGGSDWREAIVEALENSGMLVIFFSEDCNNSRQLKKELAIADQLEKPVVPILIEDTRPRGAYLYELADRNWLQAFPDPMSKIDAIVEQLAELAGKSVEQADEAGEGPPFGGFDGFVRTDTPNLEPDIRPDLEPGPGPGTGIDTAAGAAPEEAPVPDLGSLADREIDRDMEREEAPAPQPRASRSFPPSTAAPSPAKPVLKRKAAPSLSAQDFVRNRSAAEIRRAQLNDILPFRWIDLLFLVPALSIAAYVMLFSDILPIRTGAESELSRWLAFGVMSLPMIAFYGAVVFPFRYYLRRRTLWTALSRYVVSSALLYAVAMGGLIAGIAAGFFPNERPEEFATVFGVFWIVLTVIAFIIYGALSAQRAIRHFRRNVKKL